MSVLERQVWRTRRRLTNNILLDRLMLGLLAGAGLWAVTILVVRLLAWPVPLWHGAWLGASLAGLVAAVGTILGRPSALRAAVTLDAAAGLKERISTAWLVRGAADPFAQAAVGDAEKTAARIHVPAHVRLTAPALWPWSLATMLTAVLLFLFMPTVGLLQAQPKQPEIPRAEIEAEHQAITAEFEDELNKIKELAQDNPNLKDLAEDIKPIDMPDAPGLTPEDVRREALKRIDDVRDKLEQRLESAETNPLKEAKRMLNRLQPEPGDKAAAKLSQALAAGDFEGAKQALQDAQKELEEAAKNAEDPAAKEQLAELEQQLEKLADQINKLSDTTQLQKELENKTGLSGEEAKKLLDELAKMDPKQLEKELQKRLGEKGLSQEQVQQLVKKVQQSEQAKKAAKKLAQSLSKAAKAAKNSQGSGAAAGSGAASAASALSDAASQLSDLEMAQETMSELRAQLSDMEKLRDRVCEGRCQGKYGCSRPSNRIGSQGPNYGLGLGSRIGKEKTPYQTDPSKAPTRFQGGTITGQMLIDGPQVRGEASREALAAVEAEVRAAQDAVEREEVPRQYEKVLREYFERLAGLVREKQAAEK